MSRARIAVVGVASLLLVARAGAQCPSWSAELGPPSGGNGVDGFVSDMTVFDDGSGSGPVLVAAGNFTNAGTTSVPEKIATWDGTAWSELGWGFTTIGGFGGLATYEATPGITTSGPEIYAGGAFSMIDGLPANNIAVWGSGTWSTLVDTGTGVDGTDGVVRVCAIHDGGSGPRLYVGGEFANAGGHPANNIAMWDGSTWSAVGTNLTGGGTAGGSAPGRIDALCSFGGDLYAGGYFASADGTAAGRVARWNGASWSAVGSGLFAPYGVYDLVAFDADGPGPQPERLCAGGRFAVTSGGAEVDVARWDGTNWTALGAGFDFTVRDLLVRKDRCGPRLFACGQFSNSGSTTTSLVAGLVGADWQPIAGGVGVPGNLAYCMADYDNGFSGRDLIVGGDFAIADGYASSNIAAACVCAATLPVQRDEVVVTSQGLVNTDFVVTLIDTRPVRGPVDSNWNAPKFSNENAPSSPYDIWNHANLGDVFGVCMDDSEPPNIYVAATSVYDGPGGDSFGPSGPGGVYKLDGVTGDISTFVGTFPRPTLTSYVENGVTYIPLSNQLPNTGPALGDICFDARNHVFYVSNFEDGKIYVLDMAGNRLQAWDPFAPDDGTAGFAPLGERVWALQKTPRALFFSVWLRDWTRRTTPVPSSWPSIGAAPPNNTIFRALCGAGGLLTFGPFVAKVMPTLPGQTYSQPVSDIAFSTYCSRWPGLGTVRALLAERSMYNDTLPWAHDSRVLEWNNHEWFVGEYNVQRNCAGGADFDTTLEVLATGDALKWIDIYGVQITPASGNTAATVTTNSWLIDKNGIIGAQDKTRVGELEVYRPCASPSGTGTTNPIP